MNSREQRDALYPFLAKSAPSAASGVALLEHVRVSTIQKAADVIELRRAMLREYEDTMVRAAQAMARAFEAQHKLLAFGNGGSATDAQDAATDCMDPPIGGWRALPAIALQDVATVTALANDVGFENVFARQILAFGEAGDIALGFSTSGNSANVCAALREARRRGLLTIALTGDTGGVVADRGEADFCFVARTAYIPRVQEGHATVWHTLLELVQFFMGGRHAVR